MGRGAPPVFQLECSWVPEDHRHARQAGRALDVDRVQGGQREESIAQRVRGSRRSASEKSSGRGPRAVSGQREETGGQRGISSS